MGQCLPIQPAKPPKLLEKEVTGQIKDFLKAKGWRPLRMQRTVMPGQFQTGEPGIADFLFVYYIKLPKGGLPGIAATLWIELKKPGGKLRPQQVDWIAKEKLRGGVVWVVEDFKAFAVAYSQTFAWLHDGRLPGQVELFS